MRCPTCLGTLRVPIPVAESDGPAAALEPALETAAASAASAAPAPRASPAPAARSTPPAGINPAPQAGGRKYGFNCVYCSSRLEATESQGGSDGTCPTCGTSITIPILDRYGRLVDPRTNQVLKPDPHPVHAYAAAGERAPRIRRASDGSQQIVCPRCATASPISANICRTCGNPFTIEGTTVEGGGEGSGLSAASLVLGIVSLPGSCLIVPGPIAVVLGSIALYRASNQGPEQGGGRGMAIAGVICGSIGTLLSVFILIS